MYNPTVPEATILKSLHDARLHWPWEGGPHFHKAAAERIISLVNLKEVASQAKDAGELVKRIEAALEATIQAVLQFPDPEGPETPSHTPSIPWQIGFHWPPGPNPGPLFLAAELYRYLKQAGSDKTIEAIITRLLQPAVAADGGE